MSPCCQAKLICDFDGSNVRCWDCGNPLPPKEEAEKRDYIAILY